MKLKISDGIYLPSKYLDKFNIQDYFYQAKNGNTVSSVIWTDDTVKIPRNKEKFLKNFKSKVNFIENYIDKKLDTPIIIDKNFKLREQQKEIISKIFKNIKQNNNDIIVEMGTGLGKTAMLPYLVSKLNVKTLILVDMKMLQEQMYESFEQFTEQCDFQIIDRKFSRIADVNIATIQYLHRHPEIVDMLKNEIGLVVLDEAHCVAAETIRTTIQQFPSKYRIGLSATPSRSDGLDGILHDVFPTKVTTSGEALVPISIVAVECEHTTFAATYRETVKKLIMHYYMDYLNRVVEFFVKQKNYSIMIAIDDIELQNLLVELFREYGSAALNAKISSKERQQILQDYEDEKIKVLIGYKVLGKGINIPRMEVLINFFAATTKENLEQLIGRLNRKHHKKEKAFYIEFLLSHMFHKQYVTKIQTLKKVAEKLNIKFIKIDLDKFLQKLRG